MCKDHLMLPVQAQQKYAAQAAVSEAAAAKKAQAQARMARAEKRRSQADRAYTVSLHLHANQTSV